jgi:protein translocase SecG subunit
MIITVLKGFQIVLSVLLIVVILMQQNSAGLGAAFGGAGGMELTRRGADKFLYNATIAIAIVFFSISLAIVVI